MAEIDWRAEIAALSPIYGSEMDGSNCCISCHADYPKHDDLASHEPTCLWRRAVEAALAAPTENEIASTPRGLL